MDEADIKKLMALGIDIRSLRAKVINIVAKKCPDLNYCDIEGEFLYALLDTVRQIRQGTQISNLEAYLIRVLYLRMLRLIRARQKVEAIDENLGDPHADDLCMKTYLKQVPVELEIALSKLPPTDRQLFSLRAVHEEPYSHIAAILQIDEPNARQRFHRICKRLSKDARLKAFCQAYFS